MYLMLAKLESIKGSGTPARLLPAGTTRDPRRCSYLEVHLCRFWFLVSLSVGSQLREWVLARVLRHSLVDSSPSVPYWRTMLQYLDTLLCCRKLIPQDFRYFRYESRSTPGIVTMTKHKGGRASSDSLWALIIPGRETQSSLPIEASLST